VSARLPQEAEGLRYGEPAARWVLAAAVLGSSMAFLDMTAVNVALPSIGTELDAGVADLTWIVNSYTLTLAAFVLVGGSLGDRYGRRRVFLLGTAWFGAASLACALATDVAMLNAFRAAQGLGAALLTPGALAILQSSFSPRDRSRAIGAWSGLAGIAGAVGPFLGGWLVEVASWRWIFLINVPVVVLVVALALRHVPESRAGVGGTPLDLPGALLAAAGLGSLTYGLSRWAELGAGAPEVQLALVGGVLTLLGFLAWERAAAEPMLPLGLFLVPRFGVTNLVTFLVYAALGGVFFWLVVALQVVSGWGPLRAGLALLPVTVLMLLFSPRAGRLGDRLGPRLPLTVGPLVAAVGVALLARIGADASYLEVLAPVALLGAGLTVTVTPLTATVLAAVEDRSGLASGVNNAVARTGGLVSVAVLPTLTGLGPGGFGDPDRLGPAFGAAMLTCAGLLALGGVVAGLTIRAPRPAATDEHEACVRWHCAVDGPPPVDVSPAESARP
jgi:EmrB/QacA subfamily drug resistance transporter